MTSAAIAQQQQDPPAEPPLRLKPARVLTPPNDDKPALVLSAQRLEGRIDRGAEAEGEVALRYGPRLLRSDSSAYDQVTDLARAQGHVEISRGGNVVRGPQLALYLQRFEGEFISPSYFFSQTGGGGQAKRLRFWATSASTPSRPPTAAARPWKTKQARARPRPGS